MTPLPPPETIKVYQLLKLSTANGIFNLCATGAASAAINYIGNGMYLSLNEAEQNRTMETLKDTSGAKFFVFELEIPNPAYRE
jgi:hypothetical protein